LTKNFFASRSRLPIFASLFCSRLDQNFLYFAMTVPGCKLQSGKAIIGFGIDVGPFGEQGLNGLQAAVLAR
jgi:hypothetical protein